MKKIVYATAVAMGALLSAGTAEAQMLFPVAVEVRGGAAIPMGDFKDEIGAETGVNYGANVQLNFLPMIGIYAGYERSEFEAESGPFSGGDLIDDGFVAGGQVSLPLPMLGPWVRAGVLWNQLSSEGSTLAGREWESEREMGFEVGGGLSIPLGQVISVRPGVRYRNYAPDYPVGFGIAADSDVSSLVVDLSLKFGF